MGHSHGGHDDLDAVEVGARARNALIAFLAVVGVLAVAGLIWLWPGAVEVKAATSQIYDAPGVRYVSATIVSVEETCGEQIGHLTCKDATVTIDESGESAMIQLTGASTQAGLRPGDSVEVAEIQTEGGIIHAYSGTNRMPVLIALGALFLVAVFAVARWKGLFAILGLVIAGWVLVGFILPALIVGRPGIPVALAGSTAIMFVVLYVAHGISIRTSTARWLLPPTRRISRFSRTRSSLGCSSSGSSPISSRKMVPPDASSKAPMRRTSALVNAPRSWPNSSLSSSAAGTAPQSTTTKGPLARPLAPCTASAAAPLPVPVSPSSKMVDGVAAARSSNANTARIAMECPTRRPNVDRVEVGIRWVKAPAVKRTVVAPSWISAPLRRYASWTRTPSTIVEFLLLRSITRT